MPRECSKGAGVLEDLGMSGVPRGEKWVQAWLVGWLVGWLELEQKEYVGFKDQTNT